MAGKPRFTLHITTPARRDILAIIKHSVKTFGEAASLRYEALILQAMNDIRDNPERPGSAARPELLVPGARTYHLEFSRKRVSGARVKAPRHLILYRAADEGVIEIARVLHDARDLLRHIPDTYRVRAP